MELQPGPRTLHSLHDPLQIATDAGIQIKSSLQAAMDGTAKSIPQGPDQIYRASDGMMPVIEAKG